MGTGGPDLPAPGDRDHHHCSGFPEELIWRGNLYDLVAEHLSPRVVLVLTSVGFGALHVFSQSAARGTVEVALHAVGAMALGFVCAASRVRTGSIWMAIGVHSGFYFGNGFFPTEGIVYGVRLLVQIIVMVLIGLPVLGRAGSRTQAARPGRCQENPAKGVTRRSGESAHARRPGPRWRPPPSITDLGHTGGISAARRSGVPDRAPQGSGRCRSYW
ncbi:MAG TPA: CPBP family intramembrane metalloprotease [Nocardiopsis listeri]|uniref:CPBP family intramembrane glutamic endopeptidase n=1 Tax=Nocardiopsis listeri TaxID=53440 RepID=UPI001D989B91|nr:CPBP family intramembrane metalloprotease [Nocardiopsis listeri]